MNRLKRVLLVVFVLLSGVGCDQATKALARSVLAEGGRGSYLGDIVRLQTAHNRGARPSPPRSPRPRRRWTGSRPLPTSPAPRG
jgi:hypothetical protein